MIKVNNNKRKKKRKKKGKKKYWTVRLLAGHNEKSTRPVALLFNALKNVLGGMKGRERALGSIHGA